MTADYKTFAQKNPPGTEVHAVLRSKSTNGFELELDGLAAQILKAQLGEDDDDRELRFKYTEPGEKIRCFVQGVNDERILLSMIDPSTDPWKDLGDLDVGIKASGKVISEEISTYSVELAPGIVGRLAREELVWEGDSPALAEGEEVDVIVTDIKPEQRLIQLSRRRLTRRPAYIFHNEEDVDFDRSLEADASDTDRVRFHRRLLLDLAGAGIDVGRFDAPPGKGAPQTMIIYVDTEGSAAIYAVDPERLDDTGKAALGRANLHFNDADGPKGVEDPAERFAVARVLAMLGILQDLPWGLDEWMTDAKSAPTERELRGLEARAKPTLLASSGTTRESFALPIDAVKMVRRLAS
ncbi:MAG: hypothetical protein AAGE52_07285 [Myxococcota bacterium]